MDELDKFILDYMESRKKRYGTGGATPGNAETKAGKRVEWNILMDELDKFILDYIKKENPMSSYEIFSQACRIKKVFDWDFQTVDERLCSLVKQGKIRYGWSINE